MAALTKDTGAAAGWALGFEGMGLWGHGRPLPILFFTHVFGSSLVTHSSASQHLVQAHNLSILGMTGHATAYEIACGPPVFFCLAGPFPIATLYFPVFAS